MKIKTLIILFLTSFIIVNVLIYIDYETVSLSEIYRNSNSIGELIFGTIALFIIITLISFITLKLISLVKKINSKKRT